MTRPRQFNSMRLDVRRLGRHRNGSETFSTEYETLRRHPDRRRIGTGRIDAFDLQNCVRSKRYSLTIGCRDFQVHGLSDCCSREFRNSN